jgi:predicted amidohydrolase
MTGFIIDPEGKIVLKYRKVNTFLGNYVSPHDVWDRYSHDPKVLFPVLETPYGNFGIFICHDGFFPEPSRCLALNGAEIMIRPTGFPFIATVESIEKETIRNRMRAEENMAYVVVSNWAYSPQSDHPNVGGHSMIVNHKGQVVTEIPNNHESAVFTRINVNALREDRRQAGVMNGLAQLRAEVYATVYAQKTCYRPNLLLDRNIEKLDEKFVLFDENVSQMRKNKIMP